MNSSVWNSVQVPSSSGMGAVTVVGDPAAMLNTQLANALSTMGDSQYWEENIAPSTIRTSLAAADPSNHNSTPTLLRGMKWLLASISKGRNVSDFYPHVVKLVGAPSLEVKKMVYMYLVQYADHDATTRELSLLSINSFQRGLADKEQLIRALALRVLTSIRVSDVLQIQILAIQKCASDKSPYVRKCAANALPKLYDQCSDLHQKKMLLDIMEKFLNLETSTMVLTSVVIAFSELCPEKLEVLHGSFRKLCNLLADLDEWGQIVVIDTLARYCRKFFAKPRGTGSAEAIDSERRVVRTMNGIATPATVAASGLDTVISSQTNGAASTAPVLPERTGPRKIKRRVVKKGFYSDEEDGSTEEEVYVATPSGASLPVSSAMRLSGHDSAAMSGDKNRNEFEDEHLDEDHRLLLRSSLPLLKSRNSGVVLAVCSLHYYCGVASIHVRSSLGKALVRIHRDRREIQYAVLTSIKTLVKECPSAFTPFLPDFFVKAMDPSFTRLIKLDILTRLALEPNSIDAVLKELRTYIRQVDDKAFVCAAIQAVGKVTELARIVHDRHGQRSGNSHRERKEANRVALNGLYGLLTLTRASSKTAVVGECARVMERILLQLCSDTDGMAVEDPHRIQEHAMKRLLMLLVASLASRSTDDDEEEENDDDQDKAGVSPMRIPPLATATSLWMVGEWLAQDQSCLGRIVQNFDSHTRAKTRLEVARLVARGFPNLEPIEKLQAIHFATKMLLSSPAPQEAGVCEFVLSMGRADIQTDVRDRARMESNLLHSSIGLLRDSDNIVLAVDGKKLDLNKVKKILLTSKPPSSAVPLQDDADGDSDKGPFRFGTLSSFLNHRAKAAYLPLPKWASENSPSTLRDEVRVSSSKFEERNGWKVDTSKPKSSSGFYESSSAKSENEEGSDDDEDDSSDSEDEDGSSDFDSTDESDNDSDSSESDQPTNGANLMTPGSSMQSQPMRNHLPATINGGETLLPQPTKAVALIDNESDDADSSESSWDDSDDDESNDSDEIQPAPAATRTSNLLGMSHPQPGSNLLTMTQPTGNLLGMNHPKPVQPSYTAKSNGSYSQGLEGLVMAPVVVDVEEKVDPDIDRDSSDWMDLVRHELGGGLSVRARYLRGPTRDREASLIGLDPSSPAVVLLQLEYQNKRSDTGVLRRVRIISRSTAAGHIAPRRSVIPQEILALAKGKMTVAILGIEFQSVSDKEGTLQARFDLKSDRGSTPLDLRPSLGELVKPIKLKPGTFEANMSRLQGFQRVVSKFDISEGQVPGLCGAVLKQVALMPFEKGKTWKENDRKLRLVGKLPASTDMVYIHVECSEQGSGSFTVCCDNAMATNSLLALLKKALQ